MDPEYLTWFSGTGNITVRVQFEGRGKIREHKMQSDELLKLIREDRSGFVTTMSFDERPCIIRRIEIAVLENRIVLHVGDVREGAGASGATSARSGMSQRNIWVGSRYRASSPRILILGESDYGDTPHRLTEYLPSWCEGGRDQTFSRIFNSFSGGDASSASAASKRDFFEDHVFYNFVVGMAGPTRHHRPTVESFIASRDAFHEVLEEYEPEGVVVLGIQQAEYSVPVIVKMGVPYVVCPHPASYGLRSSVLKERWAQLHQMISERAAVSG